MCNFGNINNAFSEVLLESFTKKDNNKKKLFNSYLKIVKESKILKTQYLIYKNISNKYEINDLKASEYIKENIGLMGEFPLKDIINENKKVITLLGEKSKFLERGYSVKELHENIDTLITLSRKKTPKNIDKIVESFDYILSYVKSNKPVEKNEAISESVLKLAISKFNEKYSNIEETEHKVLKSIIESNQNGKKEILRNSINECVDLIDVKLNESDIETKDKLLKVKDKLLRMSYNDESFIGDISKIIELKKDLN